MGAPRRTAHPDLHDAYAILSDAELDALLARFDASSAVNLEQYMGQPVRYMRERLGIDLWAKQVELVEAMATYPRVLGKACHGIGKTFACAAYCLYIYEVFNPSITLSTAPTQDQVIDLLWKNMRILAPSGLPFMPAMPVLQDPEVQLHYAKGYTAKTAESFQGRHGGKLHIMFDEAVGVKKAFWDAADGMLTTDMCSMGAIFNPTDTSSMAYQMDHSMQWHTVQISAFDHPNIAAELAGKPPPFPDAVRLSYIQPKVYDPRWCQPLASTDRVQATDFEWPPGSGTYFRPGADFEAKVLGRWPTRSATSVWNDAAWEVATKTMMPEPPHLLPQVGCDVARFGDDLTAIHIRRGPCSLHHEAHTGFSVVQTAARLMELADQQGQRVGTTGTHVPIAVDDTGVGGGVVDILLSHGYTVIAINSLENAIDAELYPNRRSELWFGCADRAIRRRLDLTRLDPASLEDIHNQIMAPKWRQDSDGRRTVEGKDQTKKRLSRSPDDADAMNLAYASAAQMAIATTGSAPLAVTQGSSVPRPIAALENLLPAPPPRARPTASAPLLSTDVSERTDDEGEQQGRQASMAVGSTGPQSPLEEILGGNGGDTRMAYLRLFGGFRQNGP